MRRRRRSAPLAMRPLKAGTPPPTTSRGARRAPRRARRASTSRVGASGDASAFASMREYFARVDDEVMREELSDWKDDSEAEATRERTPDRKGGAAPKTLPPVFAAPDPEMIRKMVALRATPRRPDPMATIRRLGRRIVCGDAAAPGSSGVGGRRRSDSGHRARWAAMDRGDDDDEYVRGEDAGVDEEEAHASHDGLYGLLLRAAQEDRERTQSLPHGYTIEEVNAASAPCEELIAMSRAFELEDPRVGSLVNGLGSAVAHVLRDESKTAVGYTLTYENRAPDWDNQRALALPPRLAHVYIAREYRMRGLGTAFVAWWRKSFALRCEFFAVDSPNDAMRSTLRRIDCALATTRSGHGASSVHYVTRLADDSRTKSPTT